MQILSLILCATVSSAFPGMAAAGRRDGAKPLMNVAPATHSAWSRYYNCNGTNALTDLQWVQLRTDIVDLVSKGFGPVLLRLAWHDTATANIQDGTGGPHATILIQDAVFKSDPDNVGLERAIQALQPIYDKYQSSISNADLWSFAANVAIRAMGGPNVNWQCGRNDLTDYAQVAQGANNSIPVVTNTYNEIFGKFNLLGMNHTDTLVLMTGGHGVGACHGRFSGYGSNSTEGMPWVSTRNIFSNFYFNLAAQPTQYVNQTIYINGVQAWQFVAPSPLDNSSIIFLPSDLVIGSDPVALADPAIGSFATDKNAFFRYWQDVWPRLQMANLDARYMSGWVSTDPADISGLRSTPQPL